jgi:DNA invertase Pin-like site-specific DNA recombinase
MVTSPVVFGFGILTAKGFRAMDIAYSYIRYSSHPQGDGDSVRRQTEGTRDWCKRNGAILDESRNYLDRARSAYHGRHLEKGSALGAFLADVEAGDIPAGSVLIVENLDRLSRQEPVDAMYLLCGIVRAGIKLVSLAPQEKTYERNSDLPSLMGAMLELGRGHSESASKSDRITKLWHNRRRNAREAKAIMTATLPAWIEVKNGKLHLNPKRLAILRRIYGLAISGYGLKLIVRELGDEPNWGTGKRCGKGWSKRYVHKLLTWRAAIGEFQPMSAGKPVGEPIAGYYPPAIDETTFLQARAALARRKKARGPRGEKVATLFNGLLRDAMTNEKMQVRWQSGRRKPGADKSTYTRILVTAKSEEGSLPQVSFPYPFFETSILGLLKEIKPADVLKRKLKGTSKSAILAADIEVKKLRLREVQENLKGNGRDVPAIMTSLREMTEEINGLDRQLIELQQEEANPKDVAWTKLQRLIDVAESESDRLRLAELLRTIIDEMRVLIVVPRRTHRLQAPGFSDSLQERRPLPKPRL